LVTAIAQQKSESATPLGGAALADLKITLLDVVARLGEQPLAQMPQDFLKPSPQFLDWDFAQVGGT
jgi:hypothetical protein